IRLSARLDSRSVFAPRLRMMRSLTVLRIGLQLCKESWQGFALTNVIDLYTSNLSALETFLPLRSLFVETVQIVARRNVEDPDMNAFQVQVNVLLLIVLQICEQ